jgi:hypothetical protein
MADAAGSLSFSWIQNSRAISLTPNNGSSAHFLFLDCYLSVYERSKDYITRYIMGGAGAFIRQFRYSIRFADSLLVPCFSHCS